jgi:hypothetical protein
MNFVIDLIDRGQEGTADGRQQADGRMGARRQKCYRTGSFVATGEWLWA